jgi:hypothetical protein
MATVSENVVWETYCSVKVHWTPATGLWNRALTPVGTV